MNESALLSVQGLSVRYPGSAKNASPAVDDVSFRINPGETLGLVGESGSGKSTIGAAILGLASVTAGQIHFDGEDISQASARARRRLSQSIQVIFQDPYGSLNPSRTIGQILEEPLLANADGSRARRRARVIEVLEKVGMDAAAARRYPGHFSGGQRQRIAIARALVGKPRLVVCDEAVSALDLSIQAQVLNLLIELQRDTNVSYLFISHDLAVVRHMCERLLVLYRGRTMEMGSADIVHATPDHPYSSALLGASPIPHPARQKEARQHAQLTLRATRPHASTEACPFANRCPLVQDICEQERPTLEIGPTGTSSACHFRDVAPALLDTSSLTPIAGRHP